MRHQLAIGLLLGCGALTAGACYERSDVYLGGEIDIYCRENPGDCFGEVGGGCDFDEDCYDGVCCRSDNCGGGMCTYLCNNDADCPIEMLCEHGHCYFSCHDDDECGPGQECEHGDTICEYEGD